MAVRRLIRKKDFSPEYTCEYVIGEDHRMKGLFWADEQSKRNYMMFGDVVCFDATYKSNKYDLVFVPFTGIDNHNRNVTLGGALLGSETTNSYRWLLTKFVNAFGKEPQVVVTDQDPTMKSLAKNKVGPVLASNIDFNKRMCYVVWNDLLMPQEFETQWHSIMLDFGLNDHEWLNDIYNLRYDWMPTYYREEVDYSEKEDGITVTCTCKRVRKVTEFPKKYIVKRWMREAVPNTPIHSNVRFYENNSRSIEIDKVVQEITIANEYVLNRVIGDLEQLCLYRKHIKRYMSKADEIFVVATPLAGKR
ncbi:protein FAR1-RELATED SEQUENCE 3-like [Bidens hawaiensis]|uniref:protein FAR1-RELATED SEQUENCE 3-like n=1 Tax=Bidens hawaiensis TaxID=980011 RepID=UPI00404B7918